MRRIAAMLLLSFLLISTSLHAQWQSAGGPDGGTVNTLYNYSGYVFAGTYGGIFRSSDDGNTWSYVYGGISPSGVYGFAVHDSRFFAGTAMRSLLVSTDGGTTWSETADGPGSHVIGFASRASGLYAGSIWGGVARTTDYGQTWEERNTGLPVPRLTAFFEAGPAFLAAIGGGGLYRSTDEGLTWTDISAAVPAGEVRAAAQHQGDVYACFAGSGVYKSTDDGVTWNPTTATGLMYDLFSDGARLYAVDYNNLWFTDDGGATWTSRPLYGSPSQGHCGLKLPGRILIGHLAQGVTMSQDEGQTWTSSASGLRATRVLSVLKSGQTLFAGVDDLGLQRTTDQGVTWTRMSLPANAMGKTLIERSGTIFCGTGTGLYQSTDNGDTWHLINGTGYSFECLFSGPSDMYAGTNTGKVLASTDDGLTWSERGDLGTNDDINTIIDNGTVVMASTSGDGIFVSTDGGVTWAERNNGLGTNPSSQALVYADGVWYSGRSPGLYISRDDGMSWQVVSNAIRSSNSYSLAAVPGGIVVGTYGGGLYYYDTRDSVWSDITDGFSGSVVQTLAFSGSTVLLGSGADGMWTRELSDLTPAPAITPAPMSVSFGNVPTGTSATKQVTVENTGKGTIRLRSVSIAGTDASAFSATLAGSDILYEGESSRIDIEFSPTELRSYSAELVITSNDAGSTTHSIPLTGNGYEAPVARVVPASYDFGDVETGTQDETTFAVYNDGNADLEVQMPTLEGTDAASFSTSGNQMTVPPTEFRNLAVQFVPTTEGLKQARVVLRTNDPANATIEIPVEGNGVRPNEPEISVDPPSINFTSTTVGSMKSEKVRITNKGGADLEITDMILTGGGRNAFSVPDGGSMTIAPDNTVEITVEFRPTANQPYSATLLIASNDPKITSFPVLISGVGTGDTNPVIELGKTSISFGSVPIASTRNEDVQITNVGLGSLTISGFSFQGADADQFSLASGGPTTLEPNQEMTVTVSFTPHSDGVQRANLIISSNDPVTPNALLPLTGNGVVTAVEDLSASPRTLLLTAHPHPVTESARIPFVLPRASHVRIDLFNVLGSRVAVLRDAEYSAGRHSVALDASSLPAGIYLYRLSTATEVLTRRLIVQRP